MYRLTSVHRRSLEQKTHIHLMRYLKQSILLKGRNHSREGSNEEMHFHVPQTT